MPREIEKERERLQTECVMERMSERERVRYKALRSRNIEKEIIKEIYNYKLQKKIYSMYSEI